MQSRSTSTLSGWPYLSLTHSRFIAQVLTGYRILSPSGYHVRLLSLFIPCWLSLSCHCQVVLVSHQMIKSPHQLGRELSSDPRLGLSRSGYLWQGDKFATISICSTLQRVPDTFIIFFHALIQKSYSNEMESNGMEVYHLYVFLCEKPRFYCYDL